MGHSELIFKWEHFKYNQKKIQAEKVDPSPVFSHSTSIWALQTQILNFSGWPHTQCNKLGFHTSIKT